MRRRSKDFDLELFFRALADKTRLRLINLMGDDEVCVCFFVEILKTSQPKVSRHLAYLRRAGLVKARRDGLWMHYRLEEPPDEEAAQVFREVRAMLAKKQEMQQDRKKLVQFCCSPNLPASVQGAPLPTSVRVCG